jgi:dephospho-CoA kinase
MIEKCNQFEKNKILLLVVPLLFEAKFTDLCTEIWLVKCPREIQKKRLMKRNKISNNNAEKIINLQLNFEDKSKFSDVILDNSDDQKLWINTIQKLL